MRLDDQPKVIQLARSLGMRTKGVSSVDHVVRHCLGIVKSWADEFQPECVDELLDTVTAKAGLLVEEVASTEQLRELCERYAAEGELSFKRVLHEFDDDTHALTVRLRKPRSGCTHVAVIDCRGRKSARKWFSTWHEISHLLVNPQLEFEFRKCHSATKDPIESLMDKIASELAFHRNWFPVDVESDAISFAVLEDHRLRLSPKASRQSAYGTIVSRLSKPALFLVADLGFNKREERELAQGGAPVARLRATYSIPSESGREAGLFIPRYMRVPANSIIAIMFEHGSSDLTRDVRYAAENLADWSDTTTRKSLPPIPVRVEVGKAGSVVFAIMTLAKQKLV